MVDTFSRLLAKDGFEVFSEVAYYGHRIDILAVRDETLWAYEAKLSRWNRALNQAQWHMTAVDYSSVVLPLTSVNHVDRESFRQNRIGLVGLSPDGYCVLLPPHPSRLIWPPTREQLFATVQAFRETGGGLYKCKNRDLAK